MSEETVKLSDFQNYMGDVNLEHYRADTCPSDI